MQNWNLSFLIRTVISCCVLTAALLFGLAGLMYFCKLPDQQVSFGVQAIYILSCLAGGFCMGKKMKIRKFLWGIGFGAIYFLIVLLLSLLTNGGISTDISHVLITLAICAVSGMIGGIVG